jgi:hypothetical protein
VWELSRIRGTLRIEGDDLPRWSPGDMTNEQLFLSIGVPLLFNAVMFGLLWSHMSSRFENVNQRFDDMRDLWCAGLRRVEEVLGARLKHIEEQR